MLHMNAPKTKPNVSEDPYFKKVIPFRYCRKELQFRVSQDLFSSYQVDLGTQSLLRTVTPECASPFRKVLDLGCGYGAIGLTLKALNPECEVHAVDRDALALEFCRQNVDLNGMAGVQVYGSLDYDAITAKEFDLVISNIPGKAGEPVIAHMLLDAARCLQPGGTVAIVVVSPIEPTVESILQSNPAIMVVEKKSRAGHTIFLYRFAGLSPEKEQAAAAPDTYFRGATPFSFEGLDYHIETAYGLPEFDQLSYHTALLIDALKNLGAGQEKRALVLNPGVGHLAVALWKLASPHSILLADRDLLALRYSQKNLLLNGCTQEVVSTWHGVGAPPGESALFDVVVGALREEEGTEAVAQTVKQLAGMISPEGKILLGGTSTAITRLIDRLPAVAPLHGLARTKFRGFSALLLEPERPGGRRKGREGRTAPPANPPINSSPA